VHWAEAAGNPALVRAVAPHTFAAGEGAWTGNTEGKRYASVRLEPPLAVVATSNGATGSTAAMPDSLSPLGGGVAFFNMLLGEVTYGGLGTGLISMILAALLAVLSAPHDRPGTHVPRQPDWRRRDEVHHDLYAHCSFVICRSRLGRDERGRPAGLTTNGGPHGLTSIAFAYTSSFANNGQSFAGLSTNSAFYNYTTAVAMLRGAFF